MVGPDEPPDGYSKEEAETDHWAYLADVLQCKASLWTPGS